MTMTDKIITAICTTFGVTLGELKSPRRMQHLADARFAAGYLLREADGMHRSQIETILRRQHPWSEYASRRASDLCATDPRFRKKIESVKQLLIAA